MSDLKVRWRLFADESEPTSRKRGMRVYEELQRQGWDADKWDGADTEFLYQKIAAHCGLRTADIEELVKNSPRTTVVD